METRTQLKSVIFTTDIFAVYVQYISFLLLMYLLKALYTEALLLTITKNTAFFVDVFLCTLTLTFRPTNCLVDLVQRPIS